MRRKLKLTAAVLLTVGLLWGVRASYSDQSSEKIAKGYDGCPMYPVQPSLYNTAGVDGILKSADLGNRIAQPAGSREVPRANFIDDYLFDAMESAKPPVPHAGLCTDEEFLRRAYLDLTGRIPAADQVRDFLADSSPNKRAALVDALIETPEFVDRMTMFFGDLLQNTYFALTQGRTPYYRYIKNFLQENRPYDQFLSDLITALGDTRTNGTVNFLARAWETMAVRYDTIDNIVAQTGRVFLGQPLMCISCHKGQGHLDAMNLYLAQRTRFEFWNLAAFFSGLNYQGIPRGGGMVFTEETPRGYDTYAIGGLGGVRPERRPRPGDDPLYPPIYFFNGERPQAEGWRAELARIIKADKQFARTMVNYLWREFMGVGLVEAPDAFDLARLDPNNPPPEPWTIQPTNPELLEALAQDFIDHGFALRSLIRTIMTSSTYQLSAEFPEEWRGEHVEWRGEYAPYFARHFVRRMAAEAVLDSISQATEISITYPTLDMGNVYWAMQLPDPAEPIQNGPSAIAARTFLNNFFRGSRDGVPRRSEGSIQQVLELTNNRTLVYDRVRSDRLGLAGRLASDPRLTDADVVNELFLSTVSRYPSEEEKSEALWRFQSQGRARATENLLYALVNKLDFLLY